MRTVLILAALAVATVITLLFTIVDRGGREERGDFGIDSERAARATRAGDGNVEDAGEQGSGPRARDAGDTRQAGSTPRRLRLLYDDGEPAAGVTVRCASGRKLVTKIFRNGDYPEKTIWMITNQTSAVTDADGRFSVRPAYEAVLYTDPDSPAVLLAPCDPVLTEYRAARRAEVTGTLRGPDGKARSQVRMSAQLGRPEDYDTRNHRESDSFVAARGGLPIDPDCGFAMETDEQGRFTLLLAPGRNTLSCDGFGDVDIVVPANGKLDLGDITPPPAPATVASRETRELHGTVRSLSGAPLEGALVRLWDGNVGEASHEIYAEEGGAWHVTGLHAHRVIAWALSTDRHHMVIPEQSSGTIPMPCNGPVSLVAPSENEYAWVRTPDVSGFFLYVRDGVFLGGEPLSPADTIGLPQGEYRIFAVTDGGVLELSTLIRAGGPRALTGFR